MLLGNKTYTTPATNVLTEGDIYLLAGITTHQTEAISKLVARLKGSAAGIGRVRPVIYQAGKLVAVGQETQIATSAPEEWVDLRMGSAVGKVLLPGAYEFGLWYGGNTGAAMIASLAGAGESAGPFAYSPTESPPASITPGAALNPAIFAVSFAPWEPKSNVDDIYNARLPFEVAQRAFTDTSGPKKASLVPAATVGWHGVNFDMETGSFAIARTGGRCENLVGHRIQVVRRYGVYKRAIAVYCYAQRQFPAEVGDEDLSLTRRAFLGLSGWEQDVLSCDVELME